MPPPLVQASLCAWTLSAVVSIWTSKHVLSLPEPSVHATVMSEYLLQAAMRATRLTRKVGLTAPMIVHGRLEGRFQ